MVAERPLSVGRPAAIFVSAIILAAVCNLGGAVYIQGKAWFAQILLERAWSATLNGSGPTPPWPWADTWPVARLSVPELDVDQIVLAGANGRTLAFGPGHVSGTAAPGSLGASLIGGHRDSHFQFLSSLSAGTIVRIQNRRGAWRNFRVSRLEIRKSDSVLLSRQAAIPQLVLSTCYPFDGISAGGDTRYLVYADALDESDI